MAGKNLTRHTDRGAGVQTTVGQQAAEIERLEQQLARQPQHLSGDVSQGKGSTDNTPRGWSARRTKSSADGSALDNMLRVGRMSSEMACDWPSRLLQEQQKRAVVEETKQQLEVRSPAASTDPVPARSIDSSTHRAAPDYL